LLIHDKGIQKGNALYYSSLYKGIMKILFLTPYPLDEAPSQRFRFEQYFEALKKEGHQISVQSFMPAKRWRIFYTTGNVIEKSILLLSGIFKRTGILFKTPQYHFVFIHREAAPFGPPLFEWFLANVLRKKIIFDFDDAIWLTDRNESILFRILKWRSKVAAICEWSYKISCGNEYLCNYAKQFNKQVFFNPTTIDTENLHNPTFFPIINKDLLIIGWTGSHSTLKYLNDIAPTLQYIEKKYQQITFWIIADREPKLGLDRLVFKPWSIETEIYDLAQFSIGLMPLPNDQWALGKCGFKILQYMALKIPTVASPVGVNTKIIQHGKNGFLPNDLEDWRTHLEALIENEKLRNSIGSAGRDEVCKHYSTSSNTSSFLELFR
jgi:glycosyltransferase involved in cell wall biosynthesis